MREVNILKTLIQDKLDELNPNVFSIQNEIALIAYTAEEQMSNNRSALARIQAQVKNEPTVGILKTSASRYSRGRNISFDWTLSFDINVDLLDARMEELESLLDYLKETEEEPITAEDRSIVFAMNMTTVFNIQAGQRKGDTYTQVMMTGSCSMSADAEFPQAYKHYLRVGGVGSLAKMVNVLSVTPITETDIDDMPVEGSYIKLNRGISTNGMLKFEIQYNADNTLHQQLFDIAIDQTKLHTSTGLLNVSYKRMKGEATQVEWDFGTIISITVGEMTGSYIAFELIIARGI